MRSTTSSTGVPPRKRLSVHGATEVSLVEGLLRLVTLTREARTETQDLQAVAVRKRDHIHARALGLETETDTMTPGLLSDAATLIFPPISLPGIACFQRSVPRKAPRRDIGVSNYLCGQLSARDEAAEERSPSARARRKVSQDSGAFVPRRNNCRVRPRVRPVAAAAPVIAADATLQADERTDISLPVCPAKSHAEKLFVQCRAISITDTLQVSTETQGEHS